MNKGYWAVWQSTELHRCSFPSKCWGGELSSCAPGFTGQLCNQCESATFRIRVTECVACWPLVGLVGQLCVPLLLYLAYLYAVLRSSEHPARLFTLKTVIIHMQLLYLISYLRISFPPISPTPARRQLLRFAASDRPASELSRRRGSRIRKSSNRKPTAALLGDRTCGSLLTVLQVLEAQSLGTPLVTIQTLFPLLACKSVDSAALLFQDMARSTPPSNVGPGPPVLPSQCVFPIRSGSPAQLAAASDLCSVLPYVDLWL